jgi:hypothetical protein
LLNPNDIETTVLKMQAAIYGTIGANGVILITTKQVKNSKPRISFNSYTGFQETTKSWLVECMHYCSMKVMQTEVIQFLF